MSHADRLIEIATELGASPAQGCAVTVLNSCQLHQKKGQAFSICLTYFNFPTNIPLTATIKSYSFIVANSLSEA
jgi:hypothetical protein